MFMTWLAVFVLLLLIEAVSFNLITIWFALGALVTSVVSIYVDNTTIQLGVFVATSFISLLLTKPMVKKLMNKKTEHINLDRIIGMTGLVTQTIDNISTGEVKVDGKRWSAYSTKEIKEGSRVEILAINGVKLEVKELEDK